MFAAEAKREAQEKGQQIERERLEPQIKLLSENVAKLTKEKVDLVTEKDTLATEKDILRQQLENASQEVRQERLTSAGLQGRINALDQQYTQYKAGEDLTVENLEQIIHSINELNNQLEIARNDGKTSQLEISKLEGKLLTLEKIRKDSFIDRAAIEYIKCMSRRGTYAGEPELCALAKIHKREIEVWSKNKGAYVKNSNTFLPKVPGQSPVDPIRLLLLNAMSDVGAHYQTISPSFDPRNTLQDTDLIPIHGDGNCLFASCFTAHAMHLGNTIDDIINSSYRLRLEVCNYLQINREILRQFFENILERAKTEATNMGSDLIFDEIPLEHKLREKIKNIFANHYSDYLDENYQRANSNSSVSSSDSLNDLDDFTILGSIDHALEFKDNDARVKNFLESVAERYIEVLNPQQSAQTLQPSIFLGGPIELKAIAEIYDCRINLKSYADEKYQGNETIVFETTYEKNKDITNTHICISVINMGQYNAVFIPTSINGIPINLQPPTDPAIVAAIEAGTYDNKSVFKACTHALNLISATTGKIFADEDLRKSVTKYLTDKWIRAKTKHPKLFYKSDLDGITYYFRNHIEKSFNNDVREFKLISTKELTVEATALRAVRKTIFKIAEEVIKSTSKEISEEMETWRLPAEALNEEPTHLKKFCQVAGLKIYNVRTQVANTLNEGPFMLGLVWVANILLAYGEYANETLSSMSVDNTKTTASIVRTANFIVNCAHVAKIYVDEKKRINDFKKKQKIFVENLPLDKLLEIKFYYSDIEPETISGEIFNNNREKLSEKWNKAIKIEFVLHGNNESYSITKADIIVSKWLMENLTQSMILGIAVVQVILTAFSIKDLYDQVNVCETAQTHHRVLEDLIDFHGVAEILNVNDSLSPTTSPTSSVNCEDNLTMSDVTQANIALSILSIVLFGLTEISGPTRTFDYELALAIKAIQDTYSGNIGKMPTQISEIMSIINVDKELAKHLTNMPQNSSIEKGIFRAIITIVESLDTLKLHVNKLPQSHPSINAYNKLVDDVNDILEQLSIYKRESLYKDSRIFQSLSERLKDVAASANQLEKNEKPVTRNEKLSPVLFRPLSTSLNTLRGILGFSRKVKTQEDLTPKFKV